MVLIETRKETKNARNYTSQSFFIDKNVTVAKKDKLDYEVNTHIINKLPMTMKGDFISLIENNPKVLKQKNPRIQVTNATCELDEIIDEDRAENEDLGPEELDTEITKLKYNYNLTQNKIITKVIQNCDTDLYAAQKPFKTKKSKWYSVSIPLNENAAKWEFLNNIKGERERTNNINKFELIQHEKIISENPISPEKERSIERKTQILEKKAEVGYKLREVNFTQFYRSPMRSPKPNEEDTMNTSRVIRRPDTNSRNNASFMHETRTNKFDPRNRFSNIVRSRGKIELDLRNRSIENAKDLNECDDCIDMNRSAE